MKNTVVAASAIKNLKSKIENQSPLSCRGAFSIEYAAFIFILAAALLGMAVYFKRALEGRWRGVGDTFGYGRQYGP